MKFVEFVLKIQENKTNVNELSSEFVSLLAFPQLFSHIRIFYLHSNEFHSEWVQQICKSIQFKSII